VRVEFVIAPAHRYVPASILSGIISISLNSIGSPAVPLIVIVLVPTPSISIPASINYIYHRLALLSGLFLLNFINWFVGSLWLKAPRPIYYYFFWWPSQLVNPLFQIYYSFGHLLRFPFLLRWVGLPLPLFLPFFNYSIPFGKPHLAFRRLAF